MNPFGKAEVQSVDITVDVRFGREVTGAGVGPANQRRARSREPARVVLTLQPYEGQVEQRVVELPGAGEFGGRTARSSRSCRVTRYASSGPSHATSPTCSANVRTALPSTSLVLSLQRKSRGMSLAGFVVRDLPGSMLDSLATGNDTARTPVFVAHERTTLPMGRVIAGQAKLSLTVRKEKQ